VVSLVAHFNPKSRKLDREDFSSDATDKGRFFHKVGGENGEYKQRKGKNFGFSRKRRTRACFYYF